VSPRLPPVSGRRLVRLLAGLGYETLRQRGSHVRLKKDLPSGAHFLTVPLHDELAKGTLHGILDSAAKRNNVPIADLLARL
jgi:predicted RNA binding protein YcfA (HicA-like mRNA interferase family)